LGLLVVAVSVVNADDANPNRRPAGHQTADNKGRAGRKFLPRLSNGKAEYRLRVDFGRGLLNEVISPKEDQTSGY
jgi:hypothetical protein